MNDRSQRDMKDWHLKKPYAQSVRLRWKGRNKREGKKKSYGKETKNTDRKKK